MDLRKLLQLWHSLIEGPVWKAENAASFSGRNVFGVGACKVGGVLSASVAKRLPVVDSIFEADPHKSYVRLGQQGAFTSVVPLKRGHIAATHRGFPPV